MFSSRSAILGATIGTLPDTRLVAYVGQTTTTGSRNIIGLADANVGNELIFQQTNQTPYPTFSGIQLNDLGAYGNNVLGAGVSGISSPPGNVAAIYLSTDGGLNYTISDAPSPIPSSDIFTTCTVGPNLYVLGTFYNNSNSYTILTSSDGITWTPRESNVFFGNTTFRITQLTYTNDTYFAASGGGSFFVKSTDGITWTADNNNPLPVVYAIAGDQNNTLLVGGYTGGLGNNLLRSTDNGDTFTGYVVANNRAITSLAYKSNVWVGITSAEPGPAVIIRSTDGGVTWTEYSLPVTNNNALNHVFTSSDNYFVVIGSGGSVAKSTDGITWTTVPVNFNAVSLLGQNAVIKFTV